ncbi:hypothetical protein DL95DRAFT_445265 [Leptodontidium sp. 2 PMI_412]|nr:hypothetical protein DL95DRAFT_445265 [Leptodontidium sp. 2 PMI_412]
MQLLYPALLALLTFTTPSLSAKKPKDAILLSSVKTLTLRSNALTSHRRVSAIPQLKCVGPACKHHAVERMRCTNQGSSYNEEDIEWSCTADMPEDFKLGSTEVTCEGYASRDDPYILKGSCGVEYRLLLTEQGEERFGKSGSSWTGSGDGAGGSKFGGDGEEGVGAEVDGVLVAVIHMILLLHILGRDTRLSKKDGDLDSGQEQLLG